MNRYLKTAVGSIVVGVFAFVGSSLAAPVPSQSTPVHFPAGFDSPIYVGETKVYDPVFAPPTTRAPGSTAPPTTTAPAPPTGYVPSNFGTARYINSGGGSPASTASEPTGNFRFTCSALDPATGQPRLAYDDPIVYPNQPGRSHLHIFYGNTAVDASSTYNSLRTNGDGSCQGGPVNRSGYWMPALLNSAGQVVVPTNIAVYYKCNGPTAAECRNVQQYPAGLKMIAGHDMNVAGAQNTHTQWYCEFTQNKSSTIPQSCPTGEHVGVFTSFPPCWDGKNLDSPNHRAHMAYLTYDNSPDRKAHCPSTHPVLLPELSLGVWFKAGGNTGAQSGWHLSSDVMPGRTHAPGSTFHADWFGAWDPPTQAAWTSKCINGLLNCMSGQIGDGTTLNAVKIDDHGPSVVAAAPPR